MNDYKPEVPRTAFAFFAVALSAITMAAFVAAPALYDGGDAQTTLASKAPQAPVEVAISPARIDVVGVREPNVAWALHDPTAPCKPSV